MTSPADTAARSWRQDLAVYLDRRVVAMLFLGFSAGLPFPLVFTTLTAWLRDEGIERAAIGMFAWVGLLYSIKVIWAPLVDRLRVPVLTAMLGRRRSWMLCAQLGITAGLAFMAVAEPTVALFGIAVASVLVAFSSATQDIAIDAYRIEATTADRQGAMAATYQLGYRIAVLVGTAGALYVAAFGSWRSAYFAMAALMGIGIVTTLLIQEPKVDARTQPEVDLRSLRGLRVWFMDAVAGPFVDFFRRHRRFALVLLAFVGLSRIGDLLLGIMANPFYLDLGYTLTEIANIAKVFGFGVTMIGAAVGGIVVARYGPVRPLVTATALICVTNLVFAGLAHHGVPDVGLLALAISADNFAMGFSSTVFIAYMSSLTNAAYTATQYALFSSLMSLPGKFLSGFSGFIVDSTNWEFFFLYASAMGLPAVALAVVISRRPAPPREAVVAT